MKKLGLVKTHYSIGKSIIQADKPTINTPNYKEYPTNIFDLLLKNNLKQLIVVDDSISGLIELSQNCEKNNIDLIFGLRLTVCQDLNSKDEASLKTEAKYIIFIKNPAGYKDLIKISSKAATDGFYYLSRIDFKHLKELWNENNLKLAIPFYDSFLFLNTLESHTHVPQIDFTVPSLFLEDNDLPFDYIIKDKVENYAKENKLDIVPAQSIYYGAEVDFDAYQAFRCLNKRSNISAPQLDHFSSNSFSFERWLKNEKS